MQSWVPPLAVVSVCPLIPAEAGIQFLPQRTDLSGWILWRKLCFRQTFAGMSGGKAVRSKTLAVDFLHRQLVGIDAVDAADIDRNHLGAVRPLAAGERLDAAGRAEQM